MKVGDTIYLDHQATTPLHPRVLAEMKPYFDGYFGNPHSSDHSVGWEAARAIEVATTRIARLIGADPDEIVFTSGATESNNMALLGLGRKAAGSDRRRILVSAIEHSSVHASARLLEEQYEYTVEPIPVDYEGRVEIGAFEQMLGEDVLAVSIMVANNEIGTIQDVGTLSDHARRRGAVVHCDAAQAPLAVPMGDLAAKADVLSLSGHKMYGPKGVGVACVARPIQKRIEPLMYGGGQQNGLRAGTLPVPLCVGMGAAAELFIGEDVDEERGELRRRRDAFVHSLRTLAWPILVVGAEGEQRHPGNANICFRGFSAHEILGALQPRLAASTGSACASGVAEPSHVLRAIGLDRDDADACIRFSLGFDTTDDDVEQAVGLIEEVLGRLSNAGLVFRLS